MNREIWLEVTDFPPSTWQEIDLQIVTPLMSLITLCVGEVNDLTGIELSIDGQKWLTLGADYIRHAEPRTERFKALVTLPDIDFTGVATWLNKVEALGPLPPVIAHFSARRDVVTLETELLEMTTVAEGLHMRLFSEERRLSDADCELVRERVLGAIDDLDQRVKDILGGMLTHLGEPGYTHRLRGLARAVEYIAPEVYGKVSRWAEEVSAARNKYAHRTGGFLDEASIDSLFTIVDSLRWLLRTILLIEAGVDGALLAKRLRDESGYRLFLERAADNLPAIYGP